MLLENLYDTWLSGKEAVLQIVCTIWEICMSECCMDAGYFVIICGY